MYGYWDPMRGQYVVRACTCTAGVVSVKYMVCRFVFANFSKTVCDSGHKKVFHRILILFSGQNDVSVHVHCTASLRNPGVDSNYVIP